MKDKILKWLAWQIPRSLVYWCTIRVWAHATSGPYGNELIPKVTLPDALERWEKLK